MRVLRTIPAPILRPCPGPLVWFDVGLYDGAGCDCGFGAVLECATCGAVMTTGNFFDRAHQDTDILRSPR